MSINKSLLPIVLAIAVVGIGVYFFFFNGKSGPEPPLVQVAEPDAKLEAALKSMRAAVVKDPKSPEAWGNYGKLLRMSEFRDAARIAFAEAERLAPHEPRWPYLLGESYLPGEPENAIAHLLRAKEKAKQADPDNLSPSLQLAQIYVAAKRNDLADAELARVFQVEPNHAVGLLLRGMIESDRDLLDEAIATLEKCRQHPWTRKRAGIALAGLYRDKGLPQKSADIAASVATLSADGAWPDPYLIECERFAVNRSSMYRRAERLESESRWQEAATVLSDLLEAGPDPRAAIGLGRCLLRLGNLAAAEKAIRDGFADGKLNSQAHGLLAEIFLNRGDALGAKGRRDEALAEWKSALKETNAAIELNMADGRAFLLRGLCFKRLEQKNEAEESLRQSMQHSPRGVDARQAYAELLAERGDFAEATKTLLEARELSEPGDRRADESLAKLKK